MVSVLTTLIDKVDSFETVRDQIGAILLAEQTNQVALATTAGKPDPTLWALRVYSEAVNPWEFLREKDSDLTPVVNVWYDGAAYPLQKGNTVERQTAEGVYNVDVYAAARAKTDGGTGHEPGDVAAALTAHRVLRLCRNILMAGPNTYLQLRGLVGRRWISDTQIFKPGPEDAKAPQVVAGRLSFRVDFNEYSPQHSGEIIDTIYAGVNRAEDGSLFFEAEYDVT